MDLEKEINNISGLIYALSDSYEIEAERFTTSKNIDFTNKLNSVKELSRGMVFPDLNLFTKLYFKQIFYYKIVCDIHGMKWHVDYYNELISLANFFEGVEKCIVDSITIKAAKGKTIKLNKGMMTTAISRMIKEYITTQKLTFLVKDNKTVRIPKVTLYNKRFIQSLFPLFEHLRTYNPELPNSNIYSFLRDFITILNFNFHRIYPNSVGDDEPFKSYFSNLE
jgi:hypothetical protein